MLSHVNLLSHHYNVMMCWHCNDVTVQTLESLGYVTAADSNGLSSLTPTQLAPKKLSLQAVKCSLRHNSYWGLSKVVNFRPNRTPICDFLLVSPINQGHISHRIRVLTAYWPKFLFSTGMYPILTLSLYGYSLIHDMTFCFSLVKFPCCLFYHRYHVYGE